MTMLRRSASAGGISALFAAALLASTVIAAAQAAKPSGGAGNSGGASALGNIGSSREPISIDADRLDVFDKEGRAVFTGNVVAVQGETNMRCTEMNVLYESKRGKGEQTASAGATPSTGGLAQDSNIKKILCKGPVVIKTKTQTATGDKAEFDRVVNKVFLTGNAALSDGPNVTKGERVAYDVGTGVANIEGGRVRALIVPGSDGKPDAGSKPGAGKKGASPDNKGKPAGR
jgi:lipopolysaccharide export system protein LptA